MAEVQASVTISSQAPTTWQVRVTAYLLTADQLRNLHVWDPKFHAMPDTILGATAEKTVACNIVAQNACGDGMKLYQGSCRLTFRGESPCCHSFYYSI